MRLRTIDPALAMKVVTNYKGLMYPSEPMKSFLDRIGGGVTTTLPSGGPAPHPEEDTPYNRTKKVVESYKLAIDNAIAKRHAVGLDDGKITVATLAMAFVAAFFTGLTGILTSLGLGGTTAAAELDKIAKVHKDFERDKYALELEKTMIDQQLEKCDQQDSNCLEKVQQSAIDGVKKLHDSTTSPVG